MSMPQWTKKKWETLGVVVVGVIIVLGAFVVVLSVGNRDSESFLSYPEDGGDFVIYYENRESPYYAVHSLLFARSHTFEEMAMRLNEIIALPHDIPISFDACGEENAFYDTDTRSITLCYELIDLIGSTVEKGAVEGAPEGMSEEELTGKIDEEVRNIIEFIMLHEVAHALVDVLDIPITGKEEDAADQLAALILTKLDEDKQASILSTALFQLRGEQEIFSDDEFADVHSLDRQRSFNVLCLMYGNNPFQLVFLISEGILPPSRAATCGDEYEKAERSWTALLTPHFQPGILDDTELTHE